MSLLRYLLYLLLLLLFLGLLLNEMFNRKQLATISLSATALVALLLHEGYRENAYVPVAGDVPTIGFGTTTGVKLGDRTSPEKALSVSLRDVERFEGSLKNCVTVSLHQHEYDAYISLSYNIGSNAFCTSTLVRKLNTEDYAGACQEILRWDKFQGKSLAGLTKRRQEEYQKCLGY